MTEEKEKLPSYLQLQEDGSIRVKTREGEFTIREPTGEEYDNVQRIAERTPNVTEFTQAMMLVAKSLVEPKLAELELKKRYKLSTLKRLAEAVNIYVDETKSFLLDTVTPMTLTNGKESSAELDSDSEKPQTTSEE